MVRRNPTWTRDELILVLDLYLRHPPGSIAKTHPEILILSNILRKLRIYKKVPDPERFRNPAGVYAKINNFLHVDPSYKGKGRSHGSKLDEVVWREFKDDRAYLKELANSIKAVALSRNAGNLAPTDQVYKDEGAREGVILYRLHRFRERSPVQVRKKKSITLNKTGKLICEICGFDFVAFYGAYGEGFAECHHLKPLHLLKPGERVRLEDLTVVCANCHRMLHRGSNSPTVEELKRVVQLNKCQTSA